MSEDEEGQTHGIPDDVLRNRVAVPRRGGGAVLLPIKVSYYEPRGSGLTQQVLRGVFLALIAGYELQVLKKLSGKPFKLFRAADWSSDIFKLAYIRRNLTSENQQAVDDPNFAEFHSELLAWGEHWGLDDAWCLKVAFDTLADWVSHPKEKPGHYWSASIHSAGYEVTEPYPRPRHFTFEHPSWDVIWTDRTEFEESVRSAFEAKLKQYVEQVEEEASACGYEVVKGLQGKRKPLLAMEWLVRYRVQGWKISRINNHYFPASDNRNTIRKGINEAAELLGFQPYKFPHG